MYKDISKRVRSKILKMNHISKASHSGSALSIVDILVVLYFKVLNINNFDDDKRDKFILSKGHGSAALYSVLSEVDITGGDIDDETLKKFYCNDGILPGHLDKDSVKGVEVSCGSLGHGLSIGIGMALANRMNNIDSKIYVLCGDGELNEGMIWEALMFGAHQNLSNLFLIVDYNKFQGYGKTNEVINIEPLKDKFLSFGWECIEIDGHSFKEIEEAFLYNFCSKKPKVLIAHTVKGKGVNYMENTLKWHYKSPNDGELKEALDNLK